MIIHLGTNDIGDRANKAIQDINELTKQMTVLHNTSISRKFPLEAKINLIP